MLTSQESLSSTDFSMGRIYPDRLTRIAHGHYVELAEKLLSIYKNSIGCTRLQLHCRAQSVFDEVEDCPLRRVAAFIKLLDDVSQYNTDRGGHAARLRQQVFQLAAAHHPLVETESSIFGSQQWTVKHRIARELKKPWPQIERELYSDVVQYHTLASFAGYESGGELLARYNVAQVQACLFRATRMTIWARSDLKPIIQLVKLSRLMHTISRLTDGTFQLVLDGPASTLRTTRRYGVAMARIIPGLIACRDWRLSAHILTSPGKRRLLLQLSSKDGYSSPKVHASDFDSQVEAELMQKWNQQALDGWRLTRESELLYSGQTVFIPDFVATHDSGKRVFIEIVGYWTTDYLTSKLEVLRRFADRNIVVIAHEDAKRVLGQLPADFLQSIVWYKTRIPIRQLQSVICQMGGIHPERISPN